MLWTQHRRSWGSAHPIFCCLPLSASPCCKRTHLCPATGTGFGNDWFLRAVQGGDFEGGQGEVGTALAKHKALMQACALQGHRGSEQDSGLEAVWEDVAAVVPPLVHPEASEAGIRPAESHVLVIWLALHVVQGLVSVNV